MISTRTTIFTAALVIFLIAQQKFSLLEIQIAIASRLLDIGVGLLALALIVLFAGDVVRRFAMLITMLGTAYLLLTMLGGINAF